MQLHYSFDFLSFCLWNHTIILLIFLSALPGFVVRLAHILASAEIDVSYKSRLLFVAFIARFAWLLGDHHLVWMLLCSPEQCYVHFGVFACKTYLGFRFINKGTVTLSLFWLTLLYLLRLHSVFSHQQSAVRLHIAMVAELGPLCVRGIMACLRYAALFLFWLSVFLSLEPHHHFIDFLCLPCQASWFD